MRFIRRLFSVACATTLLPAAAVAQQAATISGRVTGEAGNPLPQATVFIEGMGIGTQSNDEGRYSLTVPGARVNGQQVTLTVRIIGYKSASSPITLAAGTIAKDFVLAANPLRLGEVIVTGAGTTTTTEKLGNTINSVKAAEIQKSNETNIVNALAAKAPNIEVTSQAGDPGAGSFILIRGLKTIEGSGQPLFVVDGQPIDNTTSNTNEFVDAGTAYTNRAADLNPNDIESIEVLKGAAASAIYGSRAAQGVVLITTKSGRAGETRYSLRSNATVDEVNKSIPLQRGFSRGVDNEADICDGPGCYPTGVSWGPAIPAGTPTYDHWGEAFKTGHTFDNVLTVSGGDDRRTFFLSGGRTDQEGTIKGPNSSYERTTARLKATQALNDRFRVGGNVSYMDVRAKFVQKGNNLNGLMLGLSRTPPRVQQLPLRRRRAAPLVSLSRSGQPHGRSGIRQSVLGDERGAQHEHRRTRHRQHQPRLRSAELAQSQVHDRRGLFVGRPARRAAAAECGRCVDRPALAGKHHDAPDRPQPARHGEPHVQPESQRHVHRRAEPEQP